MPRTLLARLCHIWVKNQSDFSTLCSTKARVSASSSPGTNLEAKAGDSLDESTWYHAWCLSSVSSLASSCTLRATDAASEARRILPPPPSWDTRQAAANRHRTTEAMRKRSPSPVGESGGLLSLGIPLPGAL